MKFEYQVREFEGDPKGKPLMVQMSGMMSEMGSNSWELVTIYHHNRMNVRTYWRRPIFDGLEGDHGYLQWAMDVLVRNIFKLVQGQIDKMPKQTLAEAATEAMDEYARLGMAPPEEVVRLASRSDHLLARYTEARKVDEARGLPEWHTELRRVMVERMRKWNRPMPTDDFARELHEYTFDQIDAVRNELQKMRVLTFILQKTARKDCASTPAWKVFDGAGSATIRSIAKHRVAAAYSSKASTGNIFGAVVAPLDGLTYVADGLPLAILPDYILDSAERFAKGDLRGVVLTEDEHGPTLEVWVS